MGTGYAHPGYAESLSEFGRPRVLPGSGAPFLERRIPGTPYRDAMGCYPLLACQDWSRLRDDLDDLGDELVSFTAVTDPFGGYDAACLHRCFDLVVPFKEHFVVDLSAPAEGIPSKHHRYYARLALRRVRVEEVDDPPRFLDEWTALYAGLVRRHKVTGLRAFSREAFARQLEVPGLVMLRAVHGQETVGTQLWYVQGDVAYNHLAASSPLGYELMAAYALYWAAVERLSGTVGWLDLGAGAGPGGDGADGLGRFKKGWSSGTRTAYLCGKIFDRVKYAELSRGRDASGVGYFPAYRAGELG